MNILKSYFNTQLVKAGFPDDFQIEYALSHCQGDGIAFYGDIEHTYWLGLFQYIYPNQKRKYRKFERLAKSLIKWQSYRGSLISIERNRFGYHYSHFNTMNLRAPMATDFCFFNDIRAQKEWYFPATKVKEYQALWDEFVGDLAEYIRDLSKRLAREGYRIVEATPYQTEIAYQFDTANYRIELVQTPCEFYAEKPEWLFGDLCDVDEMMQSVVEGKIHFANLYAQVLDKQTGLSLGEDHLSNLSFSPKDRSFSGYKTELISNAIADARRNVQKYAQLHA